MQIMFHEPVLLEETIEFLNVKPGRKYIDATLGGGGHAAAILRSGGDVLGIDMDPDAVRHARKRIAAEFQSAGRRTNYQFSIVRGNFRRIDEIAKEEGFEDCAGVLFDLGMSSFQIGESGRGFSFMRDERLDMRSDPSLGVKAEDLLAALNEKELSELFTKYAQERDSRRFARAIKRARELRSIKTTKEFSGLLAWVEEGSPGNFWNWYRDNFENEPSKFGSFDRRARFFQALRIAVNDEVNNLQKALPRALRTLRVGGRLAVITYHSLERSVVREFMQEQAQVITNLTPRGQSPDKEEIERNPRSRSAKLFAYEKK